MGPLVIKERFRDQSRQLWEHGEVQNDRGRGREAQITSAEFALKTPRTCIYTRVHTRCTYIHTCMPTNEGKITEHDLTFQVPEAGKHMRTV